MMRPLSKNAAKKWSFLGVYEEDIWHPLFLGVVAAVKALNPASWAPNLQTDPVKRKAAQGPTPNQEIGGLCVEWMYRHLTGTPGADTTEIDARFLAFLRRCTRPLFDGEPLSSVYYRYYCACGAAAMRWGDKWGCSEIAKCGRDMLEAYLALLLLHRTPDGIAVPGARQPRGAALPELMDFCDQLTDRGRSRALAKKKLRSGYEVAGWSVRELAADLTPTPLHSIRLSHPLRFTLHQGREWLSIMPTLKSYDPCWAVSCVGGKLHELRWTTRDGRHKAEGPRKRVPDFVSSGDRLIATLDDFKAEIPVPVSGIVEEIRIG